MKGFQRMCQGDPCRVGATLAALPETKLTVESRSEECEEVGKCVGGTCVGHSAHCARSASRREADAAARGEWRALVLSGGGGGGRGAQNRAGPARRGATRAAWGGGGATPPRARSG